MSKIEFFFWILTIMAITVLVVTSSMGFITGMSDQAITDITAAGHAASFPTTIATLRYWPFALYLIPFIWGFKAFWNKLTEK